MKVICGIYKITNPNGLVYIGKSKNVFDRWTRYRRLHCKAQKHLYRSLKKYGFNAHKFEIIKECEFAELDYYEGVFINLYDSLNERNEKEINLHNKIVI